MIGAAARKSGVAEQTDITAGAMREANDASRSFSGDNLSDDGQT